MKRLSFAIMLALCTMGVWAQEGIKVEFEGANPNIFDFAWSYLINYDPNTEDYEATSGIRDALDGRTSSITTLTLRTTRRLLASETHWSVTFRTRTKTTT